MPRHITTGNRLRKRVGGGVGLNHPTCGNNPVKGRERVADRTAAGRHDMFDRLVGDVEPGILAYPTDMLSHLIGAEQGQLEYLAAAADRLDNLVGLGGGEHPGDMVGWLLKRLEQGVSAWLVSMWTSSRMYTWLGPGAEVDLGEQVAHVLDLVVARRIEFVEIERASLFDGDTTLALTTRLAFGAQVLAVECLGEHPRRGCLAGATGAMEEVGMAHFALDNGVLQGRHDMALTTDLPELLGVGSDGKTTDRPCVADSTARMGQSPGRRARHQPRTPVPGSMAARRSAAHR